MDFPSSSGGAEMEEKARRLGGVEKNGGGGVQRIKYIQVPVRGMQDFHIDCGTE